MRLLTDIPQEEELDIEDLEVVELAMKTMKKGKAFVNSLSRLSRHKHAKLDSRIAFVLAGTFYEIEQLMKEFINEV